MRCVIGALGEVQLGGSRVVEASGTSIVVFRCRDGFHAYRNACPHRGGPVGDGPVVDGIVMCPWHGWKFDVVTGARIGHARDQLHRVPIEIEGEQLVVTVDSEAYENRYEQGAG